MDGKKKSVDSSEGGDDEPRSPRNSIPKGEDEPKSPRTSLPKEEKGDEIKPPEGKKGKRKPPPDNWSWIPKPKEEEKPKQSEGKKGSVDETKSPRGSAEKSPPPPPPPPPPAMPLGQDGKPLQPQIGPDGLVVKGPPLGSDGKPVTKPTGSDGKPLPPPPIIGADGKEIPRPKDAQGRPLPIYVTPEGQPILDNKGAPIPLKFDKDGRPLPLELPAPASSQQAPAPEDTLAKFCLWAGIINLIVKLSEIIVISVILSMNSNELDGYLKCLHKGLLILAGVDFLFDILPFMAWNWKKMVFLVCWVIKNFVALITAVALIICIKKKGCGNVNYDEFGLPYSDEDDPEKKPTIVDYIVLIYAAIAALISVFTICCLKCDCECSDDGRVSKGYGMQTNQFQGQTYRPPVQQQKVQQPQKQVMSRPATQTTTIITTPMNYYNPYMMGGYGYGMGGYGMGAYGLGYGFGGYPYYGSWYAPYYDYYDDWFW